MRVLINTECSEWLSTRQFDYTEPRSSRGVDGFVSLPGEGYARDFNVPDPSRVRLLMSQRLALWVRGTDVLLWITSWTGCAEEEMNMFMDFRRLYGESRQLIDAPGHLFSFDDQGDLWEVTGLLLFMLAFEWSGFVLQGNHESFLWVDDGWIHTLTQSREKEEEMQHMLDILDHGYL